MSNEKQEVVEDVVCEMRDWDTHSHLSEIAHNEIVSYADRIEAAIEFTLAVERAKATAPAPAPATENKIR